MPVSVNPGIILKIKTTQVELGPKDASNSNPAENGAEYKFADKDGLPLGTGADLEQLISTEFGASLPDAKNIPYPLSKIYDDLSSLTLKLKSFDLRVPATKDANGKALSPAPEATFSVALNLEYPDGKEMNIFGGLAVKGLYLTITKSADAAPTSAPTKPKSQTSP
jgi:hypothetical protein